jgi:hypothetical protein
MRPTTGCYWSTAISSRSQNCYRVLGGPDQGRLRCGVRRSGATRRFDRTCNRRPVFLPRGCVERRGGRPMKSDYVRELVCHRNCELLIAHPWEVTASGRLASSSEIVALTVLPSCLSNAFTAAFVAGPTAAQAPNCPSCMVSIMSLVDHESRSTNRGLMCSVSISAHLPLPPRLCWSASFATGQKQGPGYRITFRRGKDVQDVR